MEIEFVGTLLWISGVEKTVRSLIDSVTSRDVFDDMNSTFSFKENDDECRTGVFKTDGSSLEELNVIMSTLLETF